MAVHELRGHGEVLCHAHQRVVHALVAVAAELAQHLANHARTFERLLRVQPELVHGEQDLLCTGFAVAHVRQRAADDHGHGVRQVALLGLDAQLEILDALLRQVQRRRRQPTRAGRACRPRVVARAPAAWNARRRANRRAGKAAPGDVGRGHRAGGATPRDACLGKVLFDAGAAARWRARRHARCPRRATVAAARRSRGSSSLLRAHSQRLRSRPSQCGIGCLRVCAR